MQIKRIKTVGDFFKLLIIDFEFLDVAPANCYFENSNSMLFIIVCKSQFVLLAMHKFSEVELMPCLFDVKFILTLAHGIIKTCHIV